ncbi:hypothetical protein ABRG53_3553 [Pseudanabaena sp. ABRG5-3]|nr:hypothetical protein ABRG53_3553 [Pseudanabaena sp. ABRG5-3]
MSAFLKKIYKGLGGSKLKIWQMSNAEMMSTLDLHLQSFDNKVFYKGSQREAS